MNPNKSKLIIKMIYAGAAKSKVHKLVDTMSDKEITAVLNSPDKMEELVSPLRMEPSTWGAQTDSTQE